MEPEERHKEDLWWLLKRIKKLELDSPQSTTLEYWFTSAIGAGIPSRKTQYNLLNKLKDESTIYINGDHSSRSQQLEIQLIKPAFDNLYAKHKKYQALRRQEAEQAVRPGRYIPSSRPLRSRSHEEVKLSKIDTWLGSKSSWFIDKLWQVVVEIQAKHETTGRDTFIIPINQFKKKELDLEKVQDILAQLHDKEIISVDKTINQAKDKSFSIVIPITDDESIFTDPKTEITLSHDFKYLYSYLDKKQHPEKAAENDKNALQEKADKILSNFSNSNLPFVIRVLDRIAQAIEFAPNSFASYMLMSPSGSDVLIHERQLLEKLAKYGLYKKGEEDGIYGVSKITKWDRDLIQKCIERGRRRLSMKKLKNRQDLAQAVRGEGELQKNTEEAVNKVIGTYVCGGLVLNMKNATIKYGENKPVDISPENKEIIFLRMLLDARDEIVNYIDVVKKLKLKPIRDGDTNESFGRDVQFLRRDLGNLLKEAGMTNNELKEMIRSVRKTGYKLRCPIKSSSQ